MKKYFLNVALCSVAVLLGFGVHQANAGTLYRVDTNGAGIISATTAIISSTMYGTTTVISPAVTSVGFTGSFGPDIVYTGSWDVTSFPATATLTGLTCGTNYTYQAFATTSAGTIHGLLQSFTTSSCGSVAPTVQINSASFSSGTITVTGQLNTLGTSSFVGVGFTATPTLGTPASLTVASGHGTPTTFTGTGSTNGIFTATYTTSCGVSSVTYSINSFATGGDGGTNSVLSGPVGSQSKSVTVPACAVLHPVIHVVSAVATSQTTATITANITSLGSSGSSVSLRQVGAAAGTSRSWSESGTFGIGTYTGNLTGLTCGTRYLATASMRNYASVTTPDFDGIYFDTPACIPSVAPGVDTVSATAITATSATLNGSISAVSPSATTIGFNYSTTMTTATGTDPFIQTLGTFSTGPFVGSVTGLTCNTTYHYRAYAINTIGTGRGEDLSFATLPCPLGLPIVQTISSTGITRTSAELHGNLVSSGGDTGNDGMEYGTTVAYGASVPVSLFHAGVTGGYSTGFTITSLSCNTLYHYRAWASNSVGAAHGTDMTFTTASCASLPTVLTVSATSITASTVTLTGNLTDLGGAPSTTAGFNYGTTTAYGSTVTMSSPYTVPTLYVNTTITGLTCNTLYHYRAWATNSAGTTNGSDMTFTTSICLTPPTVTTDSVTPSSTGATFNGTIVSLGGASSASVRGFSYNTTTTLATIGLDPAIDSGVGTYSTGPYSLTITGLTCATTYHYRAYAENTTGMGHGADMSFTTLACSLVPPTVHTITATVTGTTATLKGHLDSFGTGASGPLTSASVAFNFGGTTVASSTPTLTTLTNFTGTATVACGSTYSYFATATNAGGGATTDLTPVSFTTPACPATAPTVVTDPATAITDTTATISGHVTAFGTSATSITSRTLSASSGGAGSTMTVITTLPSPFSQSLVGLTCNTAYTFTASAMNNAGLTGTGATLSFTTSACPIGAPTVTTTAATAITTTTATINGTVTSIGAHATSMTSRGFTGSFGTPITVTGSFGTGVFSSALTGLTCNTNYTFTAMGSNNAGLSDTGSTLSFTTSACPVGAPTVTTATATVITTTGATLNGSVTALGLGATSISSRGFTTSFGAPISVSGTFSTGAFTANVTGLTCNSAYSFVAKATSNVAVSASGASVAFRTAACPAGAPAVTTDTATSVSDVSATINATVTSLGTGATSLTPSFEYGTSTALGTSVPVGSSGWITAPRAYSTVLSGLTCGTTYYYQAQVTNDGGASASGLIKNFTTDACTGAPSVTTVGALSITATSATLKGNLVSNGGDASTATYFEYGTTTAYGLSTSGVVTSVGAFSDSISGLSCGTTYHYRAGAFNSSGSDNGADLTFTTTACAIGTPAVTTNTATGITATSATVNGTVTSLGSGATSATRGFAGSFGTAVVLSGSITSVPSAYSYTVTGLVCNTTYTYNATVTNNGSHSAGGATLSFTTSACPIGAPTVTTTSASAVTTTSATLGGNLTSTGGASSTTTSFEYGTTTAYGITVSASTMSTTGTFTASTGSTLACNTMYHYRAKALNSGGSANGGDVTFTTSACPIGAPTVTTTSASAITATSATLGGNLTSTGGASSTTVSFEYGTTTAYGATVSGGTLGSAGTFSGGASGLSCHTTYHYRAKATNAGGSANGTDATFMTGVCDPTVTTVSGSLLSGILTGNLTSLGAGATSASVGFYYGATTAYSSGSVNATTPGPTMSSTGTFTANVPVGKVSCNNPWHLKAWARNASGVTVTGADVSFCN